jgi:hypothetical protein
VKDRLKGLTDEQREVVVATVERQAAGAMRRSRTSMANERRVIESMVPRIWKAFGLKPHQRLFRRVQIAPDDVASLDQDR